MQTPVRSVVGGVRVHNRYVAVWDGPQYPEDLMRCADSACPLSHMFISYDDADLIGDGN